MAAVPCQRSFLANGVRSRFRSLLRDRAGATAIEFAILLIPLLMVLFATFETFIAFAVEQVVVDATNKMARQLKTGQITFNLGRSTDMTETEFRQAYCDLISIAITCSPTEAATPDKLWIDLQAVADFADIPTTIPRVSTDARSDLDTTNFAFSPGGPNTINMLRVYYRREVITDLVRPYISNLTRSGDTSPSEFLIVGTTAFKNENYP